MPYCKTEACARGYVPILVKARTRKRDGHILWEGSFHKNHGTPMFQVTYDKGKALQINPAHVLWEEAGGEPLTWGYTLSRTCENVRCIGHVSPVPRGLGNRRPGGIRTPKLPVMPLVRFIAARGEEFNLPESDHKAIKWAKDNSGQIDLYIADRICCDTLNIHPYSVWGNYFFEVTA